MLSVFFFVFGQFVVGLYEGQMCFYSMIFNYLYIKQHFDNEGMSVPKPKFTSLPEIRNSFIFLVAKFALANLISFVFVLMNWDKIDCE